MPHSLLTANQSDCFFCACLLFKCLEHSPVSFLHSPVSFLSQNFQAGINGKDLTIALEPEAASVYCMRHPIDMAASLRKGAAIGPFSKGVKYMVVDIGGKVFLVNPL